MSYTVAIERDESRAWIARVPAVPGCHTYGRSLRQVRRRIREALGLWVDDADVAELVEEVRLPDRARRAVRKSRAVRKRAEHETVEAHRLTTDAARILVDDFEFGVRDVGELLGLSHQRVQQLVRGST